MKRALPFLALLCMLGCGHNVPVATCNPPATQTVVISPAEVGKKYLVEFATAGPNQKVCGRVPPGLTVSTVNGVYWLSGTATTAGEYRFWIVPQ